VIDHPFDRLLSKTQYTDAEKALIYAVMRFSTADGWSHLTPADVYDKMIAEFEEIKMLAGRSEVPEDTPGLTPRIQ
jgi:hypothetical protein